MCKLTTLILLRHLNRSQLWDSVVGLSAIDSLATAHSPILWHVQKRSARCALLDASLKWHIHCARRKATAENNVFFYFPGPCLSHRLQYFRNMTYLYSKLFQSSRPSSTGMHSDEHRAAVCLPFTRTLLTLFKHTFYICPKLFSGF